MKARCIGIRQSQRLFVLMLLLMLAIGLSGCASCAAPKSTPTPSPVPPTPTSPPTTTSTPAPSPTATPTQTPRPTATATAIVISPPPVPILDPAGSKTLEPGQRLPIRAIAPGAKKFSWTLVGDGTLTGADTEADVVTYLAPAKGDGAAITVIASNDQGASPRSSGLIIRIQAAPMTKTMSLDAAGIPAGFMSGSGAPERVITLEASQEGCHTGTDCLKVTYRRGDLWGGVFWWPLTCGESGTTAAWQRVQRGTCGVNLVDVGGFRAIERLSFWARGAQGGEAIEFKVGAVDILPIPGRSLGRVTLQDTWTQYSIELEGMDLTNAIGLFAWVAADISNPRGATFYLDDIQFEGTKK